MYVKRDGLCSSVLDKLITHKIVLLRAPPFSGKTSFARMFCRYAAVTGGRYVHVYFQSCLVKCENAGADTDIYNIFDVFNQEHPGCNLVNILQGG